MGMNLFTTTVSQKIVIITAPDDLQAAFMFIKYCYETLLNSVISYFYYTHININEWYKSGN